jgi:hypothetical protein
MQAVLFGVLSRSLGRRIAERAFMFLTVVSVALREGEVRVREPPYCDGAFLGKIESARLLAVSRLICKTRVT